jgi:hypothetical protein
MRLWNQPEKINEENVTFLNLWGQQKEKYELLYINGNERG